MDSINKNQQEDNYKDLSREDAIKKIKELVDKNPGCFFCTAISTGHSKAARPMSVLKTDDNGTLWFLSANDSHKNKEITMDSSVHLYFQGSSHSDYMHLSGDATISEDKAKIKELWNPILKVWFTEGENDPRISVIKVVPSEGYYWDTKHGKAVAGLKMVVGAIIGKTMDDSIEGNILV
jgi:general stress protein 26